MAIKHKTRGIIALVILLFFVLSSSFLSLKTLRLPKSFSLKRDKLSKFEKRYIALRELLPDSGEIGYVSDVPLTYSRKRPSTTKAMLANMKNKEEREYYKKIVAARREYRKFQYLVSPLILYPGLSHKFVIVNLKNIDKDYLAFIPKNFTLIKDLGNGVMLIEDKSK